MNIGFARIYTLIKNVVYAIVLVSVPRLSYTLINNKEKTDQLYQEVFDLISLFVIPITVGLFSLSNQLVVLAGGSQYADGTKALMILSIAIIFGIYSTYYSDCVLVVNGHENKCLIATSITALLNIILNVFMLPVWGIEGASVSTLIAEIINYTIQRLFAKGVAAIKISKKNILSCVCGSAFVFLFSFFIIRKTTSIGVFLILVCVCVMGYFVICYYLKNTIILNLVSTFYRKIKKVENIKK